MKMKDSEVSWVGEIPENWSMVPFKSFLKKKKEILKHWENQNILSLTMNGVIIRDLENPTGKMPATFDGYQTIDKGNFILCLFDIDVTPRCVGVANDDGVTSPAYSQYEVKYGVTQYYYYLLLMLDNDKILLTYSKTLRSTLTDEYFGAIKVPITQDISEQQKIADFLDSKIALIDQIIADTKRSIEELKSYKQSLITETVTKGLDPNVPMKDSGVEWIGKIPEGWKLPSLGQLSSKIGSGKTPLGGANVYQESGILFIRSQNVYDTGLLLGDKATYISKEVNEQMKNTEVRKQDVLLNITGGSIGRSVKYNLNVPANVNQHVCIIRSIDSIIDPDFLTYFLNSSSGQINVNYFQTGGNREGLNFEQIKKFKIPLPVMREQKNIIIFLDERIKKIDALIKDKNLVISENESYKKSLIYEYVTGKKQVI